MHFSWRFVFAPHHLAFNRRIHAAAFSLLFVNAAHAARSSHSASASARPEEAAPTAEAKDEETTYDWKGDCKCESSAVETAAAAGAV